MKSIMHDKSSGTCYLCMRLHNDFSEKQIRHEHHALFGTANRNLSEKYGLKVYLCLGHHEEGKEAVHRNAEMARLIKMDAQIAFESRWPELDFREIFGRNYLKDGSRQQVPGHGNDSKDGFCFIEDGIDGFDFDWQEKEQNMLENEYRFNGKFKAFVDQYCADQGITVEQAFEDEVVKGEFRRYTEV